LSGVLGAVLTRETFNNEKNESLIKVGVTNWYIYFQFKSIFITFPKSP
jgi:hypothetical protein